jgi:hypothetical protein
MNCIRSCVVSTRAFRDAYLNFPSLWREETQGNSCWTDNLPSRDFFLPLLLHVFRKMRPVSAAALPAIAVFGLLSWYGISRRLVLDGYLAAPPLVSVVEIGRSATQIGTRTILAGTVALQLHGGVRFSEGSLIFDGENGFVSADPIPAWDCERLACSVELKVSFDDLPPIGQSALLIGQSSTPSGWHLIYHDQQLILQLDGGAGAVSASWKPKRGQFYDIKVFSVRDQSNVRIDGRIVARAATNPMLGSSREFTFGGRGGPIPIPLHGRLDNVRLAVGSLTPP